MFTPAIQTVHYHITHKLTLDFLSRECIEADVVICVLQLKSQKANNMTVLDSTFSNSTTAGFGQICHDKSGLAVARHKNSC